MFPIVALTKLNSGSYCAELDGVHNINELEFTLSDQYLQNYQIYVSTDSVSWKPLLHNKFCFGKQFCRFKPQCVRFIRLTELDAFEHLVAYFVKEPFYKRTKGGYMCTDKNVIFSPRARCASEIGLTKLTMPKEVRGSLEIRLHQPHFLRCCRLQATGFARKLRLKAILADRRCKCYGENYFDFEIACTTDDPWIWIDLPARAYSGFEISSPDFPRAFINLVAFEASSSKKSLKQTQKR